MTPFSAALRSEWTKLTSLRSIKLMVTLGVLGAIGLTALLAVFAGETWHHWDAAEVAEFEPIGLALIGGLPSAIVFLVIGVKAATSEYASGMIRLTLTATPRRGRVLAAKTAVVAAIMLAAGLVLTAGTELVAQAIFRSYGIESASLGNGDLWRVVLASAALSPQFPLIAMALGFVLRSTAGAVIAVFALILAPAFFGGLVPRWWQDHLLEYLPASASDAITIGHLEGSVTTLNPGVATLVVLVWMAGFLGGAWAVLERRDA